MGYGSAGELHGLARTVLNFDTERSNTRRPAALACKRETANISRVLASSMPVVASAFRRSKGGDDVQPVGRGLASPIPIDATAASTGGLYSIPPAQRMDRRPGIRRTRSART
jgi:hypothetical protein